MKEWLKPMFIILAFTGFMLVIGTVGALELDNISNEQLLRQALISFGIFIFSVIGYRAVNWEDDSEMH